MELLKSRGPRISRNLVELKLKSPHRPQPLLERQWTIESRQYVQRRPVAGQNIVRAIACQRALELSAIAEINRHARHGPHGLPMQDVIDAEKLAHLAVRIKR